MGAVIELLAGLGLARWVGWAAMRAILSRMAVSPSAIREWVKAYVMSPSGAATLGLTGWNVFHSSALDEIGAVMGDRPESFEKADLLAWVGRLGVNELNGHFGTNFSTIYPPAQFVEEFKTELFTQVVNGGGSLIPRNQALDFANETARRFQLNHNVSILGQKYGNRDTTAKRLNRERQKKYRDLHKRFQVWKTSDTYDLVNEARAKLLIIRYEQKVARIEKERKRREAYEAQKTAHKIAHGLQATP